MFIILLTMLLLNTASGIIDVNNAIREITLTLMSTSSLSLTDRYALVNSLPWPIESVIYAFMSNLGDIIIIWRTYAFWQGPGERWIMLLPTAFLLGSVITSCLLSFCAANAGQGFENGNFVHPPFCKNVQFASYVTSLATTTVATAMICYKTWLYRRSVRKYLDSTTSRTRVEKVMIILVESGILYLLFFLESVVGDTGDIHELEESTLPLQFASIVWTYMTSHILGIYPTVIVILVASQKSYIETSIDESGNTPSVDQMSFAVSRTIDWENMGSRAKITSDGRSTAPRDRVVDVNIHDLRGDEPERNSN